MVKPNNKINDTNMKISEIIAMLEIEMLEGGDNELMIYDSNGDLIIPKSFSFGSMSTDDGFIDTVSFSEWE
jgi:hypothetical protein